MLNKKKQLQKLSLILFCLALFQKATDLLHCEQLDFMKGKKDHWEDTDEIIT